VKTLALPAPPAATTTARGLLQRLPPLDRNRFARQIAPAHNMTPPRPKILQLNLRLHSLHRP
jgi:hypothetical protein